MRYLHILLLSFLFYSCTEKEENYIWEDDEFTKRIETGENDFIDKVKCGDFFYGFTKVSIALNKVSNFNSQITYVYVLDSISADLNGESVPIDFTFFGDSIAELTPRSTFSESGKLKIHIYVSWYYADINEARYTDGEPVYIGTEIDSKEINIMYIDQISKNDFEFTYPLHRQFNFLVDEYAKGYFRAKDTSLGLFFNKQEAIAKFTDIGSNQSINVPITYNPDLDIMEHDIPLEFLLRRAMYKISYHINDAAAPFYENFFRTSYYKNFKDKWENENPLKAQGGNWRDYIEVGVHSFGINTYPVEEEMDSYESYQKSKNSSYLLPLVQFYSDAPKKMTNTKEQAMYDDPNITLNRDSKYRKYGYPALDAIYFRCRELTLSDDYLNGEEYVPTNAYNCEYFVTALASLDLKKNYSQVNELYPNLEELDDKLSAEGIKFDFPLIDVFYVMPGIGLKTTTILDFQIK